MPFSAQPALRPLHGLLEPGGVHRLQQVIDGVHLERLDGVLVERGDEYQRRVTRRPAARSRRATSNPVRPGI